MMSRVKGMENMSSSCLLIESKGPLLASPPTCAVLADGEANL